MRWRILRRHCAAVFTLLAASLLATYPVSAQETVVIRKVLDGDTVVLGDGRHVRYIGINAPEIEHGTEPAEWLGPTAHRVNRTLVQGRTVRLEFETERRDQYGRWLAHIVLSGKTHVGNELVMRGLAHVLVRPPNIMHASNLRVSQRKAMAAGRGMWHDWDRRESPCVGNRRSGRFHLKSCPYGQRTAPSNRIDFRTTWDAFWQGYAPCKRCRPWRFSAPAARE